VVDATHSALNAVASQPEVEQKLVSLGLQPRSSKTPEEAAVYLRSEYKNWGEIVKRSGVPKEL
jgi:tripartite-type tricarboxylate transporter receptor subunit TctC